MLKPGLYIISTPIGNLQDITIRAIETLKSADIIFCEDTRVSLKLLQKYSIHSKLAVYNDHHHEKQLAVIIECINAGQIVGLISDSGTPIISDPGYKLARDLRNLGLHIEVIPGVCSVITALTLSSLPSHAFYFAGFIPRTYRARQSFFDDITSVKGTLIFFERMNRLHDSLVVAQEVFGNRKAVITRELTKLYQEVFVNDLSELISFTFHNKLKGELVLLIEGFTENAVSLDSLETIIAAYLMQQSNINLTVKNIVQHIQELHPNQIKKRDLYNLVQKIKNNL